MKAETALEAWLLDTRDFRDGCVCGHEKHLHNFHRDGCQRCKCAHFLGMPVAAVSSEPRKDNRDEIKEIPND